MTEDVEEIVDVIVVGAGISGLYAAYRIKQKSPELKVLVLEAKGKSNQKTKQNEFIFDLNKDRVGGRTLTVDLKTSKNENETDRFDLGGQWVTEYDRIYFSYSIYLF